MAGESARAKADELRARAREHAAQADVLVAAAARWERGEDGEQRVAAVLDGLREQQWMTLHDRRLQPGSPGNIDHIAVSAAGVVLIDAKFWSGRLQVRDGSLRCAGRRRDADVDAAVRSARVLAESLPPGTDLPVRAVLCFVDADGLDEPQQVRGATCLRLEHLAGWLSSLPPVADTATAALAYRRLTGV